MNRKHRAATMLLALAMVLALIVPAWAGVTDVTGGGVTNTYTHTYHTKINAKATFTLKDGTAHTIEHESGFVVGSISDEAAQAEIAAYYKKVNDYLAGDGAGLVLRSSTKKMVFDHFESSNIISTEEDGIIIGNIEELEKAYQEGGVNKNLDVHEYQVYNITETYGVPVRSSGSSAPSITAVLNGSSAKSATDYSGGIYGLIFRVSAAYSGFTGVQVDGKTIDKSNYTVEDNGGTEVYLKAVYLRTLAAGKHTLTVLTSAGDMTTEFTVGGVMTAPKTFDAGIALYAGMAALSAGGVVLWKKKD